MAQYTTEDVLEMIVKAGGSENLDLTGVNLNRIDLSASTIQRIFVERVFRERHSPSMRPDLWNSPANYHLWYSGAKEAAETRKAAVERGTISRTDPRAGLVAVKRGVVLKGARLHRAELTLANLQGANLQDADLSFSYLYRADLSGARLWSTDLSHARLGRATLAPLPRFDAPPSGKRRDVPQRVSMQNAVMHWTDFTGAAVEDVLLYHAKLSETRIALGQVQTARNGKRRAGIVGEEAEGRWDDAQAAYAALRKNFTEMGRTRDVVASYMRERLMEQRGAWPTQQGTKHVRDLRGEWEARLESLRGRTGLVAVAKRALLRTRIRLFGGDHVSIPTLLWLLPFTPRPKNVKVDRNRWVGLWLMGQLTGYWESPLRVAFATTLIILLFGLLYLGVPGMLGAQGVPATSLSGSEAMLFSLLSFSTMSFGDLVPVTAWGRLAVGIQGLFGPLILALFIFVLCKRLKGA